MAETRTAADVDDLLSNAEWLRALAGRLLRDDSEVEDLVHETWVAALRRPMEGVQNLPSWLAAVICNLSRRRMRHAERHEELHHDHELALEDRSPSPSEALDLAAASKRVVGAVLALPEPFRSTVLLTFYEGLPSREIARRAGIPEATVRTRLRRGLLRLRRKLDVESERRAGFSAIVMLAGPGAQIPTAPVQPAGLDRLIPFLGLPATIGVFALFAYVVSTARDGGSRRADALGLRDALDLAVDPEREAASKASDPNVIAGPEALERAIGAAGSFGPLHDGPGHHGGGSGFEEAFDEERAEVGTGIPQPAIGGSSERDEVPLGATSYSASIVEERLDRIELACTPATKVSGRGRSTVAGGSGTAQISALHQAAGWKAHGLHGAEAHPGDGTELDEKDDETGRQDVIGQELDLGEMLDGALGARGGGAAFLSAGDGSSTGGGEPDESALLCTCPERLEALGSRPRIAWLLASRPRDEPLCPLHSATFEGRAVELIECAGPMAILVAWGPSDVHADRCTAPFEVLAVVRSPALPLRELDSGALDAMD